MKTTPIPVKFDRQGHSCNFYGGLGPTRQHLFYEGGNKTCGANTLQHLGSCGYQVPPYTATHYAIFCGGCFFRWINNLRQGPCQMRIKWRRGRSVLRCVDCGAPNSATLVHAAHAPRVSVRPLLATNVPEEPCATSSSSRSVLASRWQNIKELFTLLDLCVSSLRRGHANLLCIVPILTDDPRRESEF